MVLIYELIHSIIGEDPESKDEIFCLCFYRVSLVNVTYTVLDYIMNRL